MWKYISGILCCGGDEEEDENELKSEKKQKQNCKDVLFLGISGSGKTNTFLQMSGSSQNKKQKKKQNDFQDYCYDNDKRIVDCPSINLDDISEREQFALNIQSFMEKNYQNQNLIIGLAIFVKFERTDIMKQNISKIVATFNDYNDLILIVVTSFELSENQEEDKRHLTQKFSLFFKNYNQDKIIFIKSQDQREQIKVSLNKGIEQLDKRTKFSLEGTVFCKITDSKYQQIKNQFKQIQSTS